MTKRLFTCLALGAMASIAMAEGTVIYNEDFSDFKTKNPTLKVVPSGHPDFANALEITSTRQEKQIRQGNWSAYVECGGAGVVVDYHIKFVTLSARYGILMNSGTHKAITVVENGRNFQVAKSMAWTWEHGPKVSVDKWYRMRYVINNIAGMFSVYIDDMEKPAFPNMSFRDPESRTLTRLWILGSESEPSTTLLGPVKVTRIENDDFPPTILSQAPYYISGAAWLDKPPVGEGDFAKAVGLDMRQMSETEEPAFAKVARDDKNLYVFFKLFAKDMSLRVNEATARDSRCWVNDCFEIFIQPDLSKRHYYHFVGNSSGAVYDSSHNDGVRDNSWDSPWSAKVTKFSRGWSVIAAIPFESFGTVPGADSTWGFNVGRENPHAKDVLSWTKTNRFHNTEQFGKLLFTERNEKGDTTLRAQKLFREIFKPAETLQLIEENMGKIAINPAITPDSLIQARKSILEEAAALKTEMGKCVSFSSYTNLDGKVKALSERSEQLCTDDKIISGIYSSNPEARKNGFTWFVLGPSVKLQGGQCILSQEHTWKLRLSGGEVGSFQVVLITLPNRPLDKVSVDVQPIKGLDATFTTYMAEFIGTALPDKKQTSFADALRPGKDFNLKSRTIVPLWIDVRLPSDAKAGTYTGNVSVNVGERGSFMVPFTVEATGLSFPKKASLDTAFCFSPSWIRDFYGKDTPPEKLTAFWQFILDHRLEPMNLWDRDHDVGMENMDYCAEHGKAMIFLKIRNIRQNAESVRGIIEKYKGRLRPVFFGHDEVLTFSTGGALESARKDYNDAKELFPDVLRLNTAPVDQRLFGYVNVWCPLFNAYIPEDAKARQQLGEKIWWYPTDYPLAPYANFNLDSPGIDPRVIPWMNWKLDITGILYWGLNREWRSNGAFEATKITEDFIKQRSLTWFTPEVQNKMEKEGLRWPEIPWLPYFRSGFNTKVVSRTNGGGNLLYPGPNWEPWPSQRLKNLRDGMQDYEYFVMLRANADALKAKGGQDALLKQCEEALKIDDKVVGGKTSYTKDFDELLAFRDKVINLIIKTNKQLEK